ncbi:MAG: hypothetical protein ABI864_06115 [Chloroflexota bacterium]
MPRSRVSHLLALASLATAVALTLAASPTLADGLPTPEPGATGAPDTATLKAIAGRYGLTCTDATSPGVPPEASCVWNSSSLNLVATFYTSPALVMQATASGTAPLPTRADDFLVDMTSPFCPPSGPDGVRGFMTSSVGPTPPSGWQYTDAACDLRFTSFSNAAGGGGQAGKSMTAWSRPANAHASAGESPSSATGGDPGLPAAILPVGAGIAAIALLIGGVYHFGRPSRTRRSAPPTSGPIVRAVPGAVRSEIREPSPPAIVIRARVGEATRVSIREGASR